MGEEIDTEFLVQEKKLPSLINTNQKEKYFNIKPLLIIQWLLLKNENLLKKSVMIKKKPALKWAPVQENRKRKRRRKKKIMKFTKNKALRRPKQWKIVKLP